MLRALGGGVGEGISNNKLAHLRYDASCFSPIHYTRGSAPYIIMRARAKRGPLVSRFSKRSNR